MVIKGLVTSDGSGSTTLLSVSENRQQQQQRCGRKVRKRENLLREMLNNLLKVRLLIGTEMQIRICVVLWQHEELLHRREWILGQWKKQQPLGIVEFVGYFWSSGLYVQGVHQFADTGTANRYCLITTVFINCKCGVPSANIL